MFGVLVHTFVRRFKVIRKVAHTPTRFPRNGGLAVLDEAFQRARFVVFGLQRKELPHVTFARSSCAPGFTSGSRSEVHDDRTCCTLIAIA